MLSLQSKFKAIGDSGCYFLCLTRPFKGNIIDLYDMCVANGLINEDCYVNDPVGVLKLCGIQCNEVVHSEVIVGDPILVVERYQKGSTSHFMLRDFDPASVNRNDWAFKDYRLFY